MIEINYGETEIRRRLHVKGVVADMRQAIEADRSVELVYVDYRDQLSDKQIDAYLSGDWDTLNESTDEWIDDQRFESAIHYLRELAKGHDIDWDEIEPDDQDELRFALEERDTSDPIKDLARHTDEQLFRLTVWTPEEMWHLFDEQQLRSAQHAVTRELARVGIEPRTAFRWARDTLAECGDWLHDWHDLAVIWSGDIETVATAGDGDQLRFTDPYLVLLDRLNGSGMDNPIVGTVTVTVGDGHKPHLDRTGAGYGWDEVACVSRGAYGNDPVVITKEEVTE